MLTHDQQEAVPERPQLVDRQVDDAEQVDEHLAPLDAVQRALSAAADNTETLRGQHGYAVKLQCKHKSQQASLQCVAICRDRALQATEHPSLVSDVVQCPVKLNTLLPFEVRLTDDAHRSRPSHMVKLNVYHWHCKMIAKFLNAVAVSPLGLLHVVHSAQPTDVATDGGCAPRYRGLAVAALEPRCHTYYGLYNVATDALAARRMWGNDDSDVHWFLDAEHVSARNCSYAKLYVPTLHVFALCKLVDAFPELQDTYASTEAMVRNVIPMNTWRHTSETVTTSKYVEVKLDCTHMDNGFWQHFDRFIQFTQNYSVVTSQSRKYVYMGKKGRREHEYNQQLVQNVAVYELPHATGSTWTIGAHEPDLSGEDEVITMCAYAHEVERKGVPCQVAVPIYYVSAMLTIGSSSLQRVICEAGSSVLCQRS